FAMGSVLPDGALDTIGHPPVFRFAGVGRVDEYSRMPDGRFMLVLRGVGRVRLTGEREMVNGYRLFDASWLPDYHPAPASSWEANLGTELKALSVALLREHAEKFRSILSEEIDLGPLV